MIASQNRDVVGDQRLEQQRNDGPARRAGRVGLRANRPTEPASESGRDGATPSYVRGRPVTRPLRL
jgi:hypothetical protein